MTTDFYMMVGLPGSGKTTYAEKLASTLGGPMFEQSIVVLSSDAIRKELWGDENDQQHPDQVFNVMRSRMRIACLKGQTIIYDATNISRKRRIGVLNDLPKTFKGKKHCIVVAQPIEEVLRRNANRERVVPEEVIMRMLKNYQPPCKGEGWDEIHYADIPRDFDCKKVWKDMEGFDQENEHHSLTLLDHCIKTQDYIVKKMEGRDVPDEVLRFAAAIHDCGKVYTKTYQKPNGEVDGQAHYTNHQNVGAYIATVFGKHLDYYDDDTTRLANLVYHHMDPYFTWHMSLPKLTELQGKQFVDDILVLHEADVQAH